MFNKMEKVGLIITGIEIIIIAIGFYAMKKSVATKLGVNVKDLKNIKTIEEYEALKVKEA